VTEFEIRQTREFSRWFDGLRDRESQARILIRIRRLSLGNIGDVASVGGGLLELKVDYGPGYRVYVMRAGSRAFVLLAGGDKRTQTDDIRRARGLAAHLKEKA
jgi:putative addiction module killer protein